jgi:hypothetical protein
MVATNHERRCKIYQIELRNILEMMHWRECDTIALPNFPELPAGYEVKRVSWSFERDALLVMVRHDSFEPIPDGGEIPYSASGLKMSRQCFTTKELQPAGIDVRKGREFL